MDFQAEGGERSIRIRNQRINIDIRAELAQYDWHRERWTESKLIAASPFRSDRRPSFFVNLDGEYAGTWGDSGAEDEYYATGNFVRLIAHLRGIDYEQAEDYLLEKYGEKAEASELRLNTPRLQMRDSFRPLSESIVTPAISRYLTKRGITEAVQRRAGTGYGKHIGFTAIPLRRANGELANVMYRATKGKRFFYERGGYPPNKLVWGIDIVFEDEPKEVVICEAPIDAMSWQSAGMAAIAVGGVSLSEAQADIIRRSPIRTIILGGDNDAPGRRLNGEVKRRMGGLYQYRNVEYGEKEKDANDILTAEGSTSLLEKITENVEGTLQFRQFALI